MSFFDSKVSVFQFNNGSLRNLSAYITSIEGLPGPREMYDKTALGDSGRKAFPGLENVVITLDGFYDDTVTTGPEAVLGPERSLSTDRAWDYGPKGLTSTYLKYYGDCLVRDFRLTSRVGNLVGWHAELMVQGVVTRGTYT